MIAQDIKKTSLPTNGFINTIYRISIFGKQEWNMCFYFLLEDFGKTVTNS